MNDERWRADNRGAHGVDTMRCLWALGVILLEFGVVLSTRRCLMKRKFSLKSRNLSRSEEMPIGQGVDIVTCKCNRFSLL
jgi:hypothetical protein